MRRMYAHGIGRMPADPHGAAAIGPGPVSGPASGTSGWFGRYGARWARTATGPTPGPPPPWGMQNVLCRFRWLTSAPNLPGWARPTSALRLAPSTYTWPPASCTAAQMSPIASSNTPCVDGYVTIERGDRRRVGVELRPQVVEVDVALVVARDDHDPHARHRRRRRVRAVGRRRDEAHVAADVASAAMPLADGEQSGELALRPGVRLQRHGVVARHLGQPPLEVGDQHAIAVGLVERRERMDAGEARAT